MHMHAYETPFGDEAGYEEQARSHQGQVRGGACRACGLCRHSGRGGPVPPQQEDKSVCTAMGEAVASSGTITYITVKACVYR